MLLYKYWQLMQNMDMAEKYMQTEGKSVWK